MVVNNSYSEVYNQGVDLCLHGKEAEFLVNSLPSQEVGSSEVGSSGLWSNSAWFKS